MKNWKTTLGGFLVGLTMLFGGRLQGQADGPPITMGNVAQAAAVIFLGLVAKDKNVTGGTNPQAGGTVPADPVAAAQAKN